MSEIRFVEVGDNLPAVAALEVCKRRRAEFALKVLESDYDIENETCFLAETVVKGYLSDER